MGRGGPGGRQDGEAPALARPHDPAVGLSEDELLARVRGGDRQALSELYDAHRPLAELLARRTCRPCDVDDVVSEAFARIIDQIERGGGPRVSFRAYLVTAVRNASADMARRHARTFPTDDVERPQRVAGTAVVEQPHSALRLESRLLTDALATLPVRWQLAVWWVSVEGRPLSEVGQELGITANAAAALAFRAREGLREAYLRLHVDPSTDAACAPWRAELPALVRDRLRAARAAAANAHVAGCPPCQDVVDRLRDLLVTGVPQLVGGGSA
ncbi:hypothetical protein GCM10023339_20250 [Alloalcanivorax gelatiniphagus]